MTKSEIVKNPSNGYFLKRYLSFKECEQYTSLSRYTLHRAVVSGKLKSIKLSPSKSGKVLFDRKDVDDFLAELKEGDYENTI